MVDVTSEENDEKDRGIIEIKNKALDVVDIISHPLKQYTNTNTTSKLDTCRENMLVV